MRDRLLRRVAYLAICAYGLVMLAYVLAESTGSVA